MATSTKDALWRKRVRERALGFCELCWDNRDTRGVEPGTDAHHVRSRRYRSTRHIVGNGVFLCRSCHTFAHQHPREFKAWFARAFPQHWAAIQAITKQEAKP